MSGIIYRSFAKLNLYLDVLERRRDGYHNIETIFQTVNLYDQLEFSEARSEISLTCSLAELDTGESNLVCRAAALLRERTGCGEGVSARLVKNIPVAAGLAGGSGNAAATLVALNRLWDLRLAPRELASLALQLGSDVPYCLTGGTVAATGRGDHLAPLAQLTETAPSVCFVLLHPAIAVSASRVYNSPALELSDERPFAGKTASFRKAIRALERGEFEEAVFNRMEGPVFADYPHLRRAKERLIEAGCVAAAMSGSGPTLFGVCATQRVAEHIATAFEDYQVSVVAPTPAGIECLQ